LLVLPLLGLNTALEAQPVKYGQAGMPFLNVNVGGRAALAGTQMAVMGDAFDMFYNPAGLGLVQGLDVMSSVTNWIADIKHYAIGAAYRSGNLGTFGVGIIWMDYGDFVRTIPNDTNEGYATQGTFTVSEYALALSYGRQVTDRFFFGGQLKFATQDLGELPVFNEISGTVQNTSNNVNNVILDFGTLFYPGFHDLRFGVSVRNFANQSDYYDQRFELPLTFDFGIAMDMLNLFQEQTAESASKLTLAVDWVHPRDFSERVHLGAEYALSDFIFVRGGYKFNYDEEGFSAGIGIKQGLESIGLKLDYTYTDFGIFDTVNRFTLGVFLP
jgi:hypothetical protein